MGPDSPDLRMCLSFFVPCPGSPRGRPGISPAIVIPGPVFQTGSVRRSGARAHLVGQIADRAGGDSAAFVQNAELAGHVTGEGQLLLHQQDGEPPSEALAHTVFENRWSNQEITTLAACEIRATKGPRRELRTRYMRGSASRKTAAIWLPRRFPAVRTNTLALLARRAAISNGRYLSL